MEDNNLNNNEYSAPQEEGVPQYSKWNNSPYTRGYAPQPQNNGIGIASMILGIISILGVAMCCIPFTLVLPFVCGIPGIVLGAFGIKRCPTRGYAVAGLTMSIIGVVLSVILIAAVIVLAATGNIDINEMNSMYI